MLHTSNPEIISRIAIWLMPHELLQAAAVCREWYQAATSDIAWQHYNVHGIDNIYQDVITRKEDLKPRSSLSWRGLPLPPAVPRPDAWDDLSYHHLAYLRDVSSVDIQYEGTMPILFKASAKFITVLAQSAIFSFGREGVISTYHLSFNYLPPWYQKDKQLVYSLLQVGFRPSGLDASYKDDRLALLAARTVYAKLRTFEDHTPRRFFFNYKFLMDREAVLDIITKTPRLYSRMIREMRQDPQVFETYLDACKHDNKMRKTNDAIEQAPKSILNNQELMDKACELWGPRLRARISMLAEFEDDEPRPVLNFLSLDNEHMLEFLEQECECDPLVLMELLRIEEPKSVLTQELVTSVYQTVYYNYPHLRAEFERLCSQ